MDKDDQKEVLFQRLKNIEGKNEEMMGEIKDQKTKKLDSPITKIKNHLFFDTNYDFRKYRLSKFFKMPSVQSKFDTFGNFYEMFKPEKNANRPKALNAAFKLYDDLTKEYKKMYERIDDKSDDWKQNYSPKKLKI